MIKKQKEYQALHDKIKSSWENFFPATPPPKGSITYRIFEEIKNDNLRIFITENAKDISRLGELHRELGLDDQNR
jgi:hypothetical protein